MICSKNPKIYISIQVVTLNSNPNPLILQFAVRAFTAIRAINTISGCLTNQIQTYSRLYFYILMVVRNILLNASLSTPVISLEDFCDLDSLLINQNARGVLSSRRNNANGLLPVPHWYRKVVIVGRIILIKMSISVEGLYLLSRLLEVSHVESGEKTFALALLH